MNMPHCSAQKQCGACQLLSLPYEKQLERKQNEMIELFEPFAGEGTVFNPIAGMDEPYYYRNKVTSPYVPGRKTKGGKKPRGKKGNAGAKGTPQHEILCGMYAAGTHRVINTDSCLLENKDAKQAVLAIRSLMQRYHMEPYNEDANTGFIRHAVIRVGHTTGELLVTVVTNGKEFPASRNFCRELKKRCPAITTVVQNVNTRQTNVILGDEGEKTLYGPGFIIDELCGLTFRISSHSFYQVNAMQTEVLYRKAIEMAHFTGTETAMDAYCGTGTIGLVAAKGLPGAETAHAARVIGVDNVASAIKDARENARHNGIENADFTAEDAGHFMDKLAKEGESLDVLLMDPPRAGSNEQFLRSACSLAPKRIVYISCNPNTQARDVEYLVKHGYQLTEVQPVDMFPHTNHVETVCLLTREKSVKSYAYVDITPSELGMGGKVKKPTYKQIQAYVLETHGLKVSPLYIANVKDEFGLEKQFSYEEAGMSAKKRPNCPSEKRAAIIDALIHFGMLDEDARETE